MHPLALRENILNYNFITYWQKWHLKWADFILQAYSVCILSKSNQVVQVALYRLKAKEKKTTVIHKDQESTDTTKVRQTAVQLNPRKKTH